MKPIRIFISYSHKDEQFRKELSSHLKLLERLGLITAWHDRQIPAGARWKAQIDTHIEEAEVILCLVSAYFFESDYCWKEEMQRALERHQRGQTIVIPVVVRSVAWLDSPLGALQALPPEAKAIEEWDHPARAWTSVVQGLMEAIKGIFGVRERTNSKAHEVLSIDPSVGVILDAFGILKSGYKSRAQTLFSPDLTVIRLREPRLAELIANYRNAIASQEELRDQSDEIASKLNKMEGSVAVIFMTALLAERTRREIQKLIAEAEAVLALEESAIQAGPATRQLFDPTKYRLRANLTTISALIAIQMDQYSKEIHAVEGQVKILQDAYRRSLEEVLGNDAWERLYGKDS